MSKNKRRGSVAVPVIMLIVAIILSLLAVGCALFDSQVMEKEKARIEQLNLDNKAKTDENNKATQEAYEKEIYALEHPPVQPQASPTWPEHKSDGWDIIDLSEFALERSKVQQVTRDQLLIDGSSLLLLNEWHSRPADFNETNIKSVGKYLGGNEKVQVDNYNISLFTVASDALLEAVNAAKAEGLDYYIVSEGYRSLETQSAMFEKKKEQLASKYSTEEALIAATRKEVSYPGTSDFNSGMSFTLRLYSKDDAEVNVPKYSTTPQAAWMNENCWKYGLIIRFPQAGWPLETTQDKSFKTGISLKMNLYRYVGKGNAAVMHYLDLCLEEYIEYLQEHPHIAVFEDGVLKYEIYRQYVGDADSFYLQLTGNTNKYTSSLDNMGGVITVFEY